MRAATMVEHAGAPPGAMLVRACPADDAGAEGAFEAGEPWVAEAARTPCRWRVLEGVSPSAAGRPHAVTLAGTRYALRYARWRPVHGAPARARERPDPDTGMDDEPAPPLRDLAQPSRHWRRPGVRVAERK